MDPTGSGRVDAVANRHGSRPHGLRVRSLALWATLVGTTLVASAFVVACGGDAVDDAPPGGSGSSPDGSAPNGDSENDGDPTRPGDDDPNQPPDEDNDPPRDFGALRLREVAGGLTQPDAIANAGDDRLFVVEKGGRIRILKGNTLVEKPFLDWSSKVGTQDEQGMLGLAFPPDHAATGRFYVYYTEASTGRGVLSRFRVSSEDKDVADPGSESVLIRLEEASDWHNGGQLAFGLDGFLYWALGDGAQSSRAPNLNSFRGKILRLDVSGATGYAIPSGNPFADQAGKKYEIWAYGLRNPWRFSFDKTTKELYIADVGQDSYEEINVVSASAGGLDFGWPAMEGTECYSPKVGCSTAGTSPVLTYSHPASGGASVTGGYVYRGADAPEIEGQYVFGDFVSGRLYRASASDGWKRHDLLDTGLTGFRPATFGVDAKGGLYVGDFTSGKIYEITQVK